jgi:Protein of unknown function (DUF3486)
MSTRAKIKTMDLKLRAELDRRLIDGSFSDYRGLAAWLSERGCKIGPTAVQRYGSAMERKLCALRIATEQARAVVDASGGADDLVNEGLMRLVQGDLFKVLVELKEADRKTVDLNALARNVASICRSSVQMRKAAEEMRDGIGRRVLAAERKVVEAARRGARGGLSATAEKRIRAALLEIAQMPMPDGETVPEIGESAARRAGARGDAAAGGRRSAGCPDARRGMTISTAPLFSEPSPASLAGECWEGRSIPRLLVQREGWGEVSCVSRFRLSQRDLSRRSQGFAATAPRTRRGQEVLRCEGCEKRGHDREVRR